MIKTSIPTRLLISFKNLNEISTKTLDLIDIIDLKNPEKGSIGSWKIGDISKVVKIYKGKKKISATLGDIYNTGSVLKRLRKFDELNLDFIKFGFFLNDRNELENFIEKIGKDFFTTDLVGVVFVENKILLDYVFNNLEKLKNSGINYLLLDTFSKISGDLLTFCSIDFLKNFIKKASFYKITIGLAGKLKESQIPKLMDLNPSIIGFRSAVCDESDRNSHICVEKVKNISAYFESANNIAIERAGA